MEQQSPKRVVLQPRDTRYQREQKAAFALVGITGGLAVLLGIFFLLDHVRSPLNTQYVGPRLLTAAEKQREELEQQSVTDTDGDGLTDFEELYNYRTSPYLRDTDGDGMTDGLEVAAGTDPSCAEGDDCETQVIDLNSGIEDLTDTQSIPTTEADLLVSQIEDLSPYQIRQLLIQNGADPDTLSQIPDEQLKTAFSETLTELYQSGQLQQFLETIPDDETDTSTETSDTTNQDSTLEN